MKQIRKFMLKIQIVFLEGPLAGYIKLNIQSEKISRVLLILSLATAAY